MNKLPQVLLGVKSATRLSSCFILSRDEAGLYTLHNFRNQQEFFFGDADDALAVLKEIARAVRANIKVLGK